MQLFQCAVRAHQSAHRIRTVVGLDLFQSIGNILKRCLPVHALPHTTLFEQGRCKAILSIESFVRETVTVGNPAFIHRIVLQRNDTHHLVVFHLHNQIGARRVMRTDRLAT